jgi:predicted dehydrogenase
MAQKAVDAGLNVLIEKPLAVSVDGVDELKTSIERRELICGIAYVLRSHPSLAAMKDAIHSGEYGSPVQVYVTAGQHFPSFRPAYSQTYYYSRATGGGAIQDAMTHLTNATEWLVGPITRVIADAAHRVLPDVDVEDVVHFIARHGTVLGSYSLNQFQSPDEVTITVVCEKGTLRYEGHKDRMRAMKSPGSSWDDHPAVDLDRDSLFIKQAHSFLDALEGHAKLLCSLGEGVQSLHVNLALLESISSQLWQELD